MPMPSIIDSLPAVRRQGAWTQWSVQDREVQRMCVCVWEGANQGGPFPSNPSSTDKQESHVQHALLSWSLQSTKCSLSSPSHLQNQAQAWYSKSCLFSSCWPLWHHPQTLLTPWIILNHYIGFLYFSSLTRSLLAFRLLLMECSLEYHFLSIHQTTSNVIFFWKSWPKLYNPIHEADLWIMQRSVKQIPTQSKI